MREIPQAPEAPSADPWAGWDSKTYQVQVVTPILGGGAKAGEPEKGFAVRPSSIRGHLRFWWRTLFANGLSGRALKDAEVAIWGGQKADGSMVASKVVVEVTGKPMIGERKSSDGRAFDFQGNFPVEAYACFPAQKQTGTHPRPEIPLVREGDTFDVKLHIHASEDSQTTKEVKASFSAWVFLGGIGARTRRGMGSLKCENPPVTLQAVLGDKIKLRWMECRDGLPAWRESLNQYKNFRQKRRDGRLGDGRGRSYWSEPESIRLITGQRDIQHQVLVNQTGALSSFNGEPTFPRAAFGLPIVTHFQSKTDPADTILVPAERGGSDRMASPVITKPLFVNGRWFAAVIFLRTSTDPGLAVQLKSNGGGGRPIGPVHDRSRIVAPCAIPDELGTKARQDPLAAFAEYLTNHQFQSGAPA